MRLKLIGGMALSATLASLGACSEGPVCKELGRCGGSPVGLWAQRPLTEDSGKYCQELVHKPPSELHRQNQPTPVTRVRVPEKQNMDWCFGLVLTPDESSPVKGHVYWWENLPYVDGRVTYKEDGQFTIDFGRVGEVSRYYSRTCLSQYGHGADCSAFAERLKVANEGAGEYNNFKCAENIDKGGCNCTFHIQEANVLFGRYAARDGVLTHFPASPIGDFSQASLCVSGDTMELSGINNSYLWDRPGLRSIELVRVKCDDGKQGPGEGGIDCGISCPNPCPE